MLRTTRTTRDLRPALVKDRARDSGCGHVVDHQRRSESGQHGRLRGVRRLRVRDSDTCRFGPDRGERSRGRDALQLGCGHAANGPVRCRSSNGVTTNHALVYLSNGGSNSWTAVLERAGNALVFTSSAFTRTTGTWIRLSVMTAFDNLYMYVDGVLMGTIATASVGTIATRVALYTFGVNADFRNLKTWDSALNPSTPF